MNTKILMTLSALFTATVGLALSFLPDEIIGYLDIDTNVILTLFLQLMGALYLGFGILNWMAKGSIIGGIYNKPIAIGNFMHFMVGAITLLKISFKIQVHRELIFLLTIVYMILAMGFAYVFLTHPKQVGT